MIRVRFSPLAASVALCLACLLAAFFLSGCVAANSNIEYGPKGPPIGDATLAQIQPGETSKAWVISLLGQPSSVAQMPDGTEVLKYAYRKEKKGCFTLFPIVFLNGAKVEQTTVYIEMKDGIVTRRWRDKD